MFSQKYLPTGCVVPILLQIENRFVLCTFRFMHRDTRPSPIVRCRLLDGTDGGDAGQATDHRSEARLRIDAKVLVFVETTYSRLGRDIAELLVYNRMK